MASKELTEKQLRFIEEYLLDLNATQAAIRAGYSAKTANEQGAQLLAKLSIQEALQAAIAERSERTKIDQDWVLKRLAALADADIKRVVEWDEGGVTLKDSESLEWADTYTINEVILKETIKESESGKEMILSREKRIKQADKKGPLELLCRHLGMLNDKVKVSGDANEPLRIDLKGASEEQLMEIIKGNG